MSSSPLRLTIDGPEGAIATGGGGSAFSRGIVWRLRGDNALVSLLGPKGPAAGPADPERSRIWPRARVAVTEPAPAAADLGRTYWIEGSELVCHTMGAQGALSRRTVLASDALAGSSPSAVRTGGRDAVAYLAKATPSRAERHARLWVEGGGTVDLSPDGAGASAVVLVAAGRDRVVAMSLDARQAMSPVHARSIRVSPEGRAELGSDDVVFIGGPPEHFTELAALPVGPIPTAFIALATDRSFALHSIALTGAKDAAVHELAYPNGLDPAPVAGAVACNRTFVFYARPEAREPNASHVLEIATIAPNGAFEVRDVAARAHRITEITAAASDERTVWVTYTTGREAFARRIVCAGL
jgi:hypothetical protein